MCIFPSLYKVLVIYVLIPRSFKVFLCVYIYKHTGASIYKHFSRHISIHMHLHTHLHMCMYVYIHTEIRTYIHTYNYANLSIFAKCHIALIVSILVLNVEAHNSEIALPKSASRLSSSDTGAAHCYSYTF